MSLAGHVAGMEEEEEEEEKNVCRLLVGKPEGSRPLVWIILRWILKR
jgi:hypothetical protein